MSTRDELNRWIPMLAAGIIALSGTTVASAQREPEDLEAAIPDETTLAAEVVRIPFELKGNKIYIDAMVNGKGPYPFIFDTGASGTVLDKSLTNELGLEPVGQSDIGDPSGSQRIPVDVVMIDEMTLGGLTAGTFQASSWDRSDLYRHMHEPPKGIVGFPVFHDFLLTIDYGTKELVIARGSLSPTDEHVIPFTAPMGIAALQCTVNGRTVESHLDTGGPHGIMVSPEFLDEGAIEGEPVVIGRARTVNTEFEIKAAHLKGAIEIAGHRVEDPVILLNELYSGANFGYDFLRHFRVTFDQTNRLVRLEKVTDEPVTLGMPQMRHGGQPAGG